MNYELQEKYDLETKISVNETIMIYKKSADTSKSFHVKYLFF